MEQGVTLRTDYYIFSKEKGKENRKLGIGFFVHHRIVSAANRAEFVSDRISYLALRGRWCNFVLFNEHDSTEEKGVDLQDSFYEELEYVFHHFPK